jgi:hypothetical protein
MRVYILLIIITILLIYLCDNVKMFIPFILLLSMEVYLCLLDTFDNKIKYGGSNAGINNSHQIKLLTYPNIINHVNPDFITKQITISKFNMTIIDDSTLICGYKQRIMPMLLVHIDSKKIIYSGSSSDEQIAFAYVCFMMDKHAIVFIDNTKPNKLLIRVLKKFGAVINYINIKNKNNELSYRNNHIEVWNKKNKDSHILKIELNDVNIIGLYSKIFHKLKIINPKRLWVITNSGDIFNILDKILPNTEFMIIQTGEKIRPYQLKGIKYNLFISEHQDNYDTNTCPFILKYGKDDDFIWNITYKIKPLHIYDDEICKIENMKEMYDYSKYMIVPKHKLHMEPVSKMFDNLTYIALNWKQTNKVHRNFTNDYYIIDGISNHFTEGIRMDCVVNRNLKISPKQFLVNNMYKIAIKSIFLYNYETKVSKVQHDISHNINKNLLDTTPLIYGYKECNSFNPIIIINFIKRYFKEWKNVNLLDPSMGWGDRLLACLALGIKSYTGFDPNLKLHPYYNEIKKMNTTTKTRFIPDKFSSKKLNTKFEIVFTSPPFFNFEIYKYSEEDNSGSYYTWLNNMYNPYLNDMIKSVNVGGYIGIYIDNIGKFKTADDTNKILSSKLTFVEKLSFQNDYYDFNGLLHVGQSRSLWVYKNINV